MFIVSMRVNPITYVLPVTFHVIQSGLITDMEIKGMRPESRQKLKSLLTLHESYRQFPYTDTTGHLTIGIGRNLSDRGISAQEAYYLLDEDIQYFTDKLNHFLPFFHGLSENRQIALIDMCFNVGIQGFLNFRKAIVALEAWDYERAAKEILDSRWADQVGERARKIADIVKTDEL